MDSQLLEWEGTAEEIRERLVALAGQRLHVTVRRADAADEGAVDSTAHKVTITDRILERFRDVPPEERSKVPPDLTDNLDHYVYGLPKK